MKYELIIPVKRKQEFIGAVRDAMEEQGMTEKDLAELIGVHPFTLYNFFSDYKKLSRFIAAKISIALGLEGEWQVHDDI